jgi:hypothetical protein
MKLYWTRPNGLQPHYRAELVTYKHEMAKGNLPGAWRHLERAHILGQPWLVQHTQIHWLMLRFGIRIKNPREILGQLPRLLLGGVKSFVGMIPTGNTGGANVPPLKKMPIPSDLEDLLEHVKNRP